MCVDNVIGIDLHHPETQGFFISKIPVTNLDPMFIQSAYCKEKINQGVS